jgi:hypothetical protein
MFSFLALDGLQQCALAIVHFNTNISNQQWCAQLHAALEEGCENAQPIKNSVGVYVGSADTTIK